VLKALGGNLPKGMYTGTRFLVGSPDTEANKRFAESYLQQFGEEPTNWAVQAYHGIYFLKAAIEKAGSTESRAVAQALQGLKLANMPWGDLEIRASDHQLINYEIGWGVTDPSLPNKVRIEFTSDWTQILQREKEAGAQAVKQ
jgi:branched-chain amino acid transport system substrate-binding protein